MSSFDWIITAIPLLIVLCVGVYSNRFVRSVADFMSANRSAGRYLLCIAGAELQAGAVVFVAAFEMFSHGGFSMGWWWQLNVPLGLLMAISGWVSYRYRETRAMTLAQFFEIRYNKSFRVLAGVTGFLSGILNFGVIPAVGARALVYFLGLPETVRFLSWTLPTFVPLMALFLTITAFIAVSGGVITVMVVNTMEGIISQLFYLILIFTVLAMFHWSQVNAVLTDRAPGYSLLNPFDSYKISDFNIWYVLIAVWGGVIGRMAWQNAGAYNSAGLTAHEGRMGGILSGWRDMGKGLCVTFLAIAAVTYLHHPDFAVGAAQVRTIVSQISDSQAREQMAAPIALAHLLPAGVRGVLCVILLMGIFGGDATHLHSWGSIFVQDVLVPLRKKPFGTRTHLLFLRCAILGVACFAFIFGSLFPMNDYINMWWGITCSIFAGAGPCIIGGLYWKKGTAAGAWSAFLTGSILSLGAIVLRMIYHSYGEYYVMHHTLLGGVIDLGRFAVQKDNHYEFFLNGTYLGFYAGLITIAVYVIVSLLTCKEDFNLDRMLHRGQYAAVKELVGDTAVVPKRKIGLGRLIGIDSDFSLGDKWIAGCLFGWSMFWFGVFVVVTIWNLIAPWPVTRWSAYWHFASIQLPIFFAVVTGVWFTWGGLRDMFALFKRLKQHQLVNELDDGTVVNNQNLDELIVEERTHLFDGQEETLESKK
jgi:SSS family solute:Na+ symporter